MTLQEELVEKRKRWLASVAIFVVFDLLLFAFGLAIGTRGDLDPKLVARFESIRVIVHTIGLLSLIFAIVIARSRMTVGRFASTSELQTYTFMALGAAEVCLLFAVFALPRTHPQEFILLALGTLAVTVLVILPTGLRTWSQLEQRLIPKA